MKKIVLILLAIFTLMGCSNKENKFYLDDEYYGKGKLVSIKAEDINSLEDKTYIVFIYNNYCNLPIPCEDIFKEVAKDNDLIFYTLSYKEMQNTFFKEKIQYAPSVVIVHKGEIIDYLDANSDDDYDKYQDKNAFLNWLKNYIYLK